MPTGISSYLDMIIIIAQSVERAGLRRWEASQKQRIAQGLNLLLVTFLVYE